MIFWLQLSGQWPIGWEITEKLHYHRFYGATEPYNYFIAAVVRMHLAYKGVKALQDQRKALQIQRGNSPTVIFIT